MNASPSTPDNPDDNRAQVGELAATLRQLNAQEHTPRQRLELLEQQAPRVNDLIPTLYRRIADVSFPLSAQSEEVAHCIITLQSELLRGYCQIAENEMHKPERMLEARIPIWLVTCHRAFYYFSELIRTLQLLSRDYAQGDWETIHRIYLHTRRRGLLQQQQGWQGQESLEHAFKRVLLRALMRPERLLPGQQHEACRSFDEWVECVRLREQWPSVIEGNHYFVDLEGDSAPFALPNHGFERSLNGRELLIDTRALAARLHQYQRQCEEGHRAITQSNGTIGPETLSRLYRAWCTPVFRSDPREPTSGRLEFAVGFEQALQHWYMGPVALARDATEATREAPLWRAEILDRSRHGLRLQTHPESRLQLRIGELLVLPEARAGMTMVGEVRWLRERPDGIQLGVKRLLAHVFPVQVEIQDDKSRKRLIAAMASVDHAGRPLIMLPRDPVNPHATLSIRIGDRHHPIRLRRRTGSTQGYETFHFYRYGEQGYVKESGLNSSQLLAALS